MSQAKREGMDSNLHHEPGQAQRPDRVLVGAQHAAPLPFSFETAAWLYVFKPLVAGTALYVKLVLRAHCVVIAFHRGESGNESED